MRGFSGSLSSISRTCWNWATRTSSSGCGCTGEGSLDDSSSAVSESLDDSVCVDLCGDTIDCRGATGKGSVDSGLSTAVIQGEIAGSADNDPRAVCACGISRVIADVVASWYSGCCGSVMRQ